MTFDARDRICLFISGKTRKERGIKMQFRSTAFPSRPSLCSLFAYDWIRRGQTFIKGFNEIISLFKRNRSAVIFPKIGIDVVRTRLVIPVNFFGSAKKNSSQDQSLDMTRMFDGIGQCERTAPRTAKNQPLLYI